jgi:hypothetical protein
MADRPTISSHPSGGRYSVATLNANFQALRDEFDNVIGTNGVAGDNNSMSNNLDMNGNNVINAGSILDGSGVDLALQAGYAEEWASKAEDSLVSVAAGGNLVDEYSSLHHSAKAEASKTAAASSATSAASSATSAATQATNAATSATTATTQASAASTSATNAATSATNAATSATNAATSATNATSIISSVGLNYNFDNSTTMADPGTGDFRLNNATVASVTLIALDATTNDTGNPDLSDFVATWDDSTSTIGGYIVGKKVGTPATFFVYSVSTVADNTGWLQLTVAHVASNGAWSSGDDCIFQFSRSGDKGDTGTGDMSDLVDDTTPQLGGDLDCNSSQIQWSKGADVASNTALPVLTDGNYFDVTGTTTITSINTTGGPGTLIKLHFDGVVTLTHHATDLILAGAANFTTEAGDELEFVEYASGDYRMTGWSLAGTAPGGGGGGAFLGEGASGASVGDSGDIIRVNQQTLDTSQTMVATDNGSCTGPFAIASGVTLTLASGSTFKVL